MISDLKYNLEKKEKNHEKFTFMKQNYKNKNQRIHFYKTLCVTKKREIQYYAMIWIGGFVLPMQKSEGVLSWGVLS